MIENEKEKKFKKSKKYDGIDYDEVTEEMDYEFNEKIRVWIREE